MLPSWMKGGCCSRERLPELREKHSKAILAHDLRIDGQRRACQAMIWSVFRKDWALLWPLVVLVTLIQVALEWATYKFGFFGVSPVAREILRLLTPAWFIGVIALAVIVVHEDTIPGVDQDWLIRPFSRTDLLLAKLLFVAVTVCVPMLVVNVADELALGFPFLPSFGDAVYKEFYLFVCLLVPAAAVAAATRNAVELIVLVAGLVLLYVLTIWISASMFGLDRCPTCDTSIAWIQSLLQHVRYSRRLGRGARFAVLPAPHFVFAPGARGGCRVAGDRPGTVEAGVCHADMDGCSHRFPARRDRDKGGRDLGRVLERERAQSAGQCQAGGTSAAAGRR